MEKLQISAQLLNQIMGYLGTRPYQEVYQLIEAIQKEAKEQPLVEPSPENHEWYTRACHGDWQETGRAWSDLCVPLWVYPKAIWRWFQAHATYWVHLVLDRGYDAIWVYQWRWIVDEATCEGVNHWPIQPPTLGAKCSLRHQGRLRHAPSRSYGDRRR